MKKTIKALAAFLSIAALSGCGGEELPNAVKLDYDNVYILEEYEDCLVGEKDSVRYKLTEEGEEQGILNENRAGKYDGKNFYYDFLENERFALVDDNGKVWGEYAMPQLADVTDFVYCMPKPEALLSDNEIVVCGERYYYNYYNKNTGEIVFPAQGFVLQEFEGKIGVIVYDPAGTRDISELESKMNGQSMFDYVLLDTMEIYMPQKSGTFGAGCDFEFWGESYTVDGLLEAPYTEDGILPYLITVKRNRNGSQIADIPEYMFMDLEGTPICQQTFRRTSGFKEGIAFCERQNSSVFWIMTKEGDFFETEIPLDAAYKYGFQHSNIEITYYPEYDLFGLGNWTEGGVKVVVDRQGNIIASEEKNNVNLIIHMMEIGIAKDSDAYRAALQTPQAYDDGWADVVASKEGFILTNTDDSAMSVFSYAKNEYTVYEQGDSTESLFAKLPDYTSKYAYTYFGMIDMTTGEIVNESSDIAVYDETADRLYMRTDDGFGYYGEDGALVEYACDNFRYLGNGNFLVERKGKSYISNMF